MSRDIFFPPQCSHTAWMGDDTVRTKTEVRLRHSAQRYS
jgi:hypothetical protein